MALIELDEVWKSYDGVSYVLKGVNLALGEGAFASIRGRSGAGKSTLLRLMGLLDRPSRGRVLIDGQDVTQLSDKAQSRLRLSQIGFIFQFFNLIPHLTVVENVELPMALAGVKKRERRERVMELLRAFGLEHLADRYPRELSGGEQQRIAVMRAMANRPRIILADEPTGHLDDESAEMLWGLFREINERYRVTIVVTTTSLRESLPTKEDYLLRRGRLYRLSSGEAAEDSL